jgi:hypothetical protein
MDKRFEARMQTVIARFGQLMASPPLSRNRLPNSIEGGGVYLFSEGSVHYYVGRSKCVRTRIMQHTRPSSLDAPFAFRRARQLLKLPATYTTNGSREQLLADSSFLETLNAQKRWIESLDVRYVIEVDPTNQALLEVYASDVLQTPYNDFNTT